ncbi:MAG: hypothetical protein ACK46X_03975 [Candidatus Sericytochromatia bacterium]
MAASRSYCQTPAVKPWYITSVPFARAGSGWICSREAMLGCSFSWPSAASCA